MLAAATAVSASAFAGVVGPAGALVPILAGLGTVGGAAAVDMQGMGETLVAISEEFATAALDGRVFNLAAEDIQDALAAPHVSPRCTPNHGGQAIVPARTRVPRADALDRVPPRTPSAHRALR